MITLNTIEEIKGAVDKGLTVKCDGDAYDVIRDAHGKYVIVCSINGYTISLQGLPGTKYANQLNGNHFYVKDSPDAVAGVISELTWEDCFILTALICMVYVALVLIVL